VPYIKEEYRQELHHVLDDLIYTITTLPSEDRNGIVTYTVYKIVKDLYWQPSWDNLSDGRKCLDEASREFCRRIIEPYEDLKIEENGDI
jgi:hypothetical protein